MFRSIHRSLLTKTTTSESMQLRELVKKSKAILNHRTKQESDQIHAAVFNFQQQRRKTATQNNKTNDSSDYLTAFLRLRGDCFLTTQHSFVDYNEMNKNSDNNNTITRTIIETNTIFTPPTHYSDFGTGLIGSPSAHHMLNSVALYFATGKHLASRSEDNTDQDFEFACNRNENFVIRGTKSTPQPEGAETLNYTIFINDIESATLEPNFLAAIKDAVEFASGYITNSNQETKNKIRLNVTVIALAPREILIDLAQAKELEDCESKWNFSEHVTLVLVPTYSYYSLSYMRNTLSCDDSCEYSMVIQQSEKLLSRLGLKIAFNYAKNQSKTTFFMQPWLKQPLMLLRDVAQAQKEHQYSDDDDATIPLSEESNGAEKDATTPTAAVPSPAAQRQYAARSLSNRMREEEFQRMQRKIAATSRRLLTMKLRQDLNKSVKEFLVRSE